MSEKCLGFLKRRLNSYLLLTLCTALPIFAQHTAAITSAKGGTANRAAADALHSKVAPRAASNQPGVVVFTGDTVFAQVVDGGTWKTSFMKPMVRWSSDTRDIASLTWFWASRRCSAAAEDCSSSAKS